MLKRLPELTRVVNHHLAKRVHHASDEETDNGVADEGTDGTTVGESTSGTLCYRDDQRV